MKNTPDIEKPLVILSLEAHYKLEILSVSRNKSFDAPESLSFKLNSKNKIIHLNLVEAGIKNLDFLNEEFSDLTHINLTGNQIRDISPLFLLKKIKVLFLGGNSIENISGISALQKLETLTLWNNPVKSFSEVSQLGNLKELYCQDTNLNTLSFVENLLNLKTLCVDSNKIFDLTPLNYLTSLKAISAVNNLIYDISLLENDNISSLDLSRNLIRSIPKGIAKRFNWFKRPDKRRYEFSRRYLDAISLFENPLELPPFSVIELGEESVSNYYDACEKFGHLPLSEGRIIFIGDGSSGKTSIIEKLLYNTFTLGREQTNGIKIEQFTIDHPKDQRKLTFNIWDFGGQEIQHAVHKFFFTEGCTYVLVLDNRKEEEPDYWLQQIESLGGGAPVFIVFNKHDENSAETADRKYLKEKYPNIVGFYNTSCKTDTGLSEFKTALSLQIVKLRTVDEQFPKNWLNIKKSIQEGTTGLNNYLKYEAFKEICEANQTPHEASQQLLLRYFNTIGSVTWFGEDTHLKFFHVLNPTWITQGVYKILTGKKTARLFGKISVKDFKELLEPIHPTDYHYSEENYIYLLTMMKKFELCDSANDRDILIPSAFGKVPKIEYSEFRGDDVRLYTLQFKEYMPLALIHRFTAKKISEALNNNYWYTGIVIKDNKSKTLAMIHADKEAKRIYIRIKGDAKLGMWEYIRRDFAVIASSYAKITYDELVSVDGNSENNVSYEDLISYIQSNKPVYFHPRLKKDFNVGYLIGLFESKEGIVEKVRSGNIEIPRHTQSQNQVPNFVIQILNSNTPNVSANFVNNVNIDVNIIEQLTGDIKADASYLKDELDPSNLALITSLEKIIEFANDAKSAKNVEEIKEKGWGRKLKAVLDALGNAGEQFKNIHEGREALKILFDSVKTLAAKFHISGISDWFSSL